MSPITPINGQPVPTQRRCPLPVSYLPVPTGAAEAFTKDLFLPQPPSLHGRGSYLCSCKASAYGIRLPPIGCKQPPVQLLLLQRFNWWHYLPIDRRLGFRKRRLCRNRDEVHCLRRQGFRDMNKSFVNIPEPYVVVSS